MERLKRSFSFRKKKDHVPESHKPHQWQEDERKVRDGNCSFQVRYLGCIEVFESRGIQVCEEAVKALKSKVNRSVWSRMSIRRKKKNKENQENVVDDAQCKGKYQRAILYVSGDALRVVDEISKGLIVDQTIEKVSFCAPDRNQEKGFAYICRDGTTRRWMCHGFLAVKETGERLSHAVGCAFAICLERKQKREKESVTVTFNDKGTSFTRTGSFRQTTLTERLADPQSAIIAEPVPLKAPENPHAVQRPHATVDMLQRQSSFRGFQGLESSPFKRQLSLRLNELPSTLDRQKQFGMTNPLLNGGMVETIPEASPTREREEEEETISGMCQQLSQGLGALATTDDPFASVPNSAALMAASSQQHSSSPAPNIPGSSSTATTTGNNNPWSTPQQQQQHTRNVSDAEVWLSTATSLVKPYPTNSVTTASSATAAPAVTSTTTTTAVVNGNVQVQNQPGLQPVVQPIQQQSPWAMDRSQSGLPAAVATNPAHRAPHLAQVKSHSVDTADIWHHQKAPSLRDMGQAKGQAPTAGAQNSVVAAHWSTSVGGVGATTNNHSATAKVDPFEAAWASKQSTNNPFQAGDVTKTFEVNL